MIIWIRTWIFIFVSIFSFTHYDNFGSWSQNWSLMSWLLWALEKCSFLQLHFWFFLSLLLLTMWYCVCRSRSPYLEAASEHSYSWRAQIYSRGIACGKLWLVWTGMSDVLMLLLSPIIWLYHITCGFSSQKNKSFRPMFIIICWDLLRPLWPTVHKNLAIKLQ